ncbi:MAG TPA: hypothetical protein VFV34_05570, partial [Blastocatellia bacterium]|nr:hypothetical protein [Blastocatellia bacterium]
GVHARSIDAFNRIVQPFMPRVRYLVTEFNIRLSLTGNPHLTNRYAMEFAERLAELMARPEIVAMYVHGVPYHSIVYWANRRLATVVGQRDAKLPDPRPGWHLTPAGQVYGLYSTVAWNGKFVALGGEEDQRYWAVESPAGQLVVTFLNNTGNRRSKRVKLGGVDVEINAAPRSIVCADGKGKVIESLTLPY